MINIFKIKKIAALLLVGMLPTLVFVFISMSNGMLWGVVCWLFMCVLMIMIGSKMLSNPFTQMLEGRGLLALNLDSTGVIGAFIVSFSKGFLEGNFRGTRVIDHFDREGTTNIAKPVKVGSQLEKDEAGNFVFKITNDEISDSRFAFNQYPVLIYNEQTGAFLRKSHLSKMEKELFAYNKLIFLSKQVELLKGALLNFGRYTIDALKPKNRPDGGLPTWVIIILVLVVGFLIFMLISNSGAGGSGVLANAVGTGKAAINPIVPAG